LFEEIEEEKALKSPVGVKTNAKKYNHFEFGDGNDGQVTPKVRETVHSTKSKHMSQWDFEDFVTPEKPGTKVLGQAVRHFGWSDDEVSPHVHFEDEGSPVQRPVVHQARPDADTHFEFVDDGTPAADRKKNVSAKGRLHNAGLGLYKDHVLHSTSDDENESEAPKGDNKRPLGNVTMAINNENRKKDFDSQWEMTDASPNPARTANSGDENGNGNAKHILEDRKKALKGLDPHWGLYENSPEQSKKENVNGGRGIKTSGDGMGGRKGAAEGWSIGNEGDDYQGLRPKGGAKEPESKGSFWDF
jgi:hypothetical protein